MCSSNMGGGIYLLDFEFSNVNYNGVLYLGTDTSYNLGWFIDIANYLSAVCMETKDNRPEIYNYCDMLSKYFDLT